MPRINREQSQRQTRQRLLASAQEIFARSGFAGASVDQIAEHAGYSKGAVYSNFRSKEELFLELLQNRMTEEIQELRALFDLGGSAAETLQALKKKYASLDKQVVWCLLATEFQLQAGRSPQFAKPFAALYRNQREAVAELVKLVAQRAGVQPPENTLELAASLMALTHGIALQHAADPDAVAPATAGKALEMFLKAILRQS